MPCQYSLGTKIPQKAYAKGIFMNSKFAVDTYVLLGLSISVFLYPSLIRAYTK